MPRRYRQRRTRRRPMRRRRPIRRRRQSGLKMKFSSSNFWVAENADPINSFYAISLFANNTDPSTNFRFRPNDTPAWNRVAELYKYVKFTSCKVVFQPQLPIGGTATQQLYSVSSCTINSSTAPQPPTVLKNDILEKRDYKQTGPNRAHHRFIRLATPFTRAINDGADLDKITDTHTTKRWLYFHAESNQIAAGARMGTIHITWYARCYGLSFQ